MFFLLILSFIHSFLFDGFHYSRDKANYFANVIYDGGIHEGRLVKIGNNTYIHTYIFGRKRSGRN